jgi:catechol 2,3-dioxygenase-like lactoylglutathione lyase family enzyme
VRQVAHTSVNVAGQLDEARRFYAQILGLGSLARPDIPGVAGHWFQAGDVEVHLVDAAAGVEAIRPTDHHVCFAVDDLDAAIEELEAAGISYLRGAQGDVVQIWITDPAGNVIELQQARERASELGASYGDASSEWATTDESEDWDGAVADGLT